MNESQDESEKKLTVDDFKKALKSGEKNVNELAKQLKTQFGMSNINHNIRFK